MFNLEIRKFKNNVIKVLNEFEAPIEVKRLAMEEIMAELRGRAEKQIREESMEEQKELENKGKEEEDEQGVQPDTLGEQAERQEPDK